MLGELDGGVGQIDENLPEAEWIPHQRAGHTAVCAE
jgi:hypothetical protein